MGGSGRQPLWAEVAPGAGVGCAGSGLLEALALRKPQVRRRGAS